MMKRRLISAASTGALVLVLTLAPTALAGSRGSATNGKGGGTGATCTPNAPRTSIDNTWAWGAPGSWGLPGQQLTYAIDVFNNDVGCGSSTFVISASTASGFAVSIPQNTITLNSASTGYLWVYVTSPNPVADGDYLLTVTVQRAGTSTATTSTSYYKVYSSDAAAPTLFWPNPWNGSAISGRSYLVGVSSSDDHAVRKIELYIDNAYTSTSLCDNVSSTCQLSYNWAIRRVRGQHTATFRSYDWLGNVGVLTTSFTVN
jgi:hypothetical protein